MIYTTFWWKLQLLGATFEVARQDHVLLKNIWLELRGEGGKNVPCFVFIMNVKGVTQFHHRYLFDAPIIYPGMRI